MNANAGRGIKSSGTDEQTAGAKRVVVDVLEDEYDIDDDDDDDGGGGGGGGGDEKIKGGVTDKTAALRP